MKVKELLQDLQEKENYKKFKEENPEAFFCSAMFILGDADKIDLNFFLPNQDKLSSFAMPFASITNHQEEIYDQKEIKNLNLKVDICELKNHIKEKTGKDYPKIIAVLHNGIWNLTCLNGMDMNRMNLDAHTGEIQKKEEGSLNDMIQIRKTSE